MSQDCIIVNNIDAAVNFKYSTCIRQTYQHILSNQHAVDSWILDMDGMSGKLYRLFINRLISQIHQPKYLEIGAWHGSTLCSAVINNFLEATVVDNWSQFDGCRNLFESNKDRANNNNNSITVIEMDFRQIDWTSQPKHNVYLFDGPHTAQDQFDGIKITLPALEDEFILIVDDWNSKDVQDGTLSALKEVGLDFVELAIKTTTDGSHPHVCRQASDWHNGYFIASVKKSKKNPHDTTNS